MRIQVAAFERASAYSAVAWIGATTERSDVLSTDGYWQPERRTELFGRFAFKFGGNGRDGLIPTAALTYIAQLRAARRIRRSIDVAFEHRFVARNTYVEACDEGQP